MENFRTIYDSFGAMVYNLCLNYLHQQQDAEEATQDVFVKVHGKLESFKEQSQLKTWIYRITVNTCLDILRKRQKKSALRLVFGSSKKVAESPGYFYHPGVQLENKEAVERIFRKIDLLPENQKTALLLKVMDDLSQKEIAEVMELSEKAVESLLSRSRSNLKKMLNEAKDG